MARIIVGGVLLRGDLILLGKRTAERDFYPGVWDMVGGHQLEGETLEQTLARELSEELGIVSMEYRLLASFAEAEPDRNGEGYYHVYLVTKWNGTPRNRQEDEHSEVTWIKLDEVGKLELAHPTYVSLFQSILR